MKEDLIEIVKCTDGWVIVVVCFLYFGFRVYKIYSSHSGLRKSMELNEKSMELNEITISTLLNQIASAINNLTRVVQQFKN